MAHAGVEAARRKFLARVHEPHRPGGGVPAAGRARAAPHSGPGAEGRGHRWQPFRVALSEPAKAYLLAEGWDARYGARHLKRAIERSLVHPMSALVASSQVRPGDSIQVEFDEGERRLLFFKDAEGAELPPPRLRRPPGSPGPPRLRRARAAALLVRKPLVELGIAEFLEEARDPLHEEIDQLAALLGASPGGISHAGVVAD